MLVSPAYRAAHLGLGCGVDRIEELIGDTSAVRVLAATDVQRADVREDRCASIADDHGGGPSK